MARKITRRRMLQTVAASAAAGPFLLTGRAEAAITAEIRDITVISGRPQKYHGWPTIARRANGQLLVVVPADARACLSLWTRRTDHLRRRRENLERASGADGHEIDDRDSGVIETAKGSILVTTFTSLAYVPGLEKVPRRLETGPKSSLAEGETRSLAGRAQSIERSRAAGIARCLDACVRPTAARPSANRTAAWSTAPMGRFNLPTDASFTPARTSGRASRGSVSASRPTTDRPGRGMADSHTRWRRRRRTTTNCMPWKQRTGRIVAQIRNHNKANSGETLQSNRTTAARPGRCPIRSVCGGALAPGATGRRSLADELRPSPQALRESGPVSADEGRTWSAAIIVSGDGPGGDLGYPSTVQLGDGSLVTVWYERMASPPMAVLRQWAGA